MAKMEIQDALSLLIDQAAQGHGGSARCAMFLLSLWDGGTYKADLQDLLYNDQKVFQAMITALTTFYVNNEQLDSYITSKQMDPIIATWGKYFRRKTKQNKRSWIKTMIENPHRNLVREMGWVEI